MLLSVCYIIKDLKVLRTKSNDNKQVNNSSKCDFE